MPGDSSAAFYIARVADQAERHLDVLQQYKEIVAINPALGTEERNILSVAYKAVTNERRQAIRTVDAILGDPTQIESRPQVKGELEKLRAKILGELDGYCQELIALIDGKLLAAAADAQAKVFFEKLKADYYRYSVEFKTGADKDRGAEAAHKAYNSALETAKAELSTNSPAYLGLVLNYSVFLYEIVGQQKEAIAVADAAYKGAIDHVDGLQDEEYSEATLIMQLLRDNVQLWTETPQAEA